MRSATAGALRTVGVAFTLLLGSCDVPQATSPNVDAEADQERGDLGTAEELAKAISAALGDDATRHDVFRAMQESPYLGNRLRLSSYVGSDAGRQLLESAERLSGRSETEIRSLMEQLPNYELHLPIYSQRLRWEGTPNLAVIALDPTQKPSEATGTVRGFTPEGEVVSIPMLSPPDRFVLSLNPATIDFPTTASTTALRVSNPVASTLAPRDAGPLHLGRATESSPSGPSRVYIPPVYQWPEINVGFDLQDCYLVQTYPPPADYDWDGLGDECEYQLAKAFAPQLVFDPGEFHPGREEAWVSEAHLVPEWGITSVRVTYLLSYYEDFGFHGHLGDSEWIDVWLENTTGNTWRLKWVTLSAHFGTLGDRSVSAPGNLFWSNAGRPWVYVAKGKHASYINIDFCEDDILDEGWGIFIPFWALVWYASGIGADDCGNSLAVGFTVDPRRNIGSDFNWSYWPGTALMDCVTSMYPAAHPGTECYWTESVTLSQFGWLSASKFKGWSGSGGATSYPEVLWTLKWKENRAQNPLPNLTVATPYVPPTQPLNSVQIWGTDEWYVGEPFYACHYQVTHSGGIGPYRYEWSYDGMPVGTGSCTDQFDPGWEGEHWIQVWVTDATGLRKFKYKTIQVIAW